MVQAHFQIKMTTLVLSCVCVCALLRLRNEYENPKMNYTIWMFTI